MAARKLNLVRSIAITGFVLFASRSNSHSAGQEYSGVLAQYVQGQFAPAVRALAAWEPARVDREPLLTAQPDPLAADVAAALVLHAEAGMQRGDFLRVEGAEVFDRTTALRQFDVHYRRSSTYADWLYRDPKVATQYASLLRVWHAMAAAYGHRWKRNTRDIEIGLVRFPEDPVLLRVRASVFEYWVGPEREGGYWTRDPSVWDATIAEMLAGETQRKLTSTSHGNFSRTLAQAVEAELRRVIGLDPMCAEAFLRLGRFYYLFDRFKDAETALEHAIALAARTQDRYVGYLAHLFRGKVKEETGFPSDATTDYREALAIYPGATSARMGLGVASILSGDIETAWTAMEPPTGRAAADPWLDYPFGLYRELPALVMQARRLIRQ